MLERQISFNKKEALRYFRAQSGDTSAEILIDAAYRKLKDELQPRCTVKKFGCETFTEKDFLQAYPEAAAAAAPEDPGKEAVLSVVRLDNGTVFHSRALARYVGDAKELYLFGATLGSRVDVALRRMALTSVAAAGAGQAVAAALIETYCDDCCEELQKQLPAGKRLKWRFSPGYGDWSLAEQKILFPVLDCARSIGLTLTDSCMMAPVKSVTAVMAVMEAAEENVSAVSSGKENNVLENNHCEQTEIENENKSQNAFSDSGNKCLRCNKGDCVFRQK